MKHIKKTHQKPQWLELCFYQFSTNSKKPRHLVDITIVQASLPHLMDNFLVGVSGSPAVKWHDRQQEIFAQLGQRVKGKKYMESSFFVLHFWYQSLPSPYVVMESFGQNDPAAPSAKPINPAANVKAKAPSCGALASAEFDFPMWCFFLCHILFHGLAIPPYRSL